MDTKEMKIAINDDIEMLKHLDLDIVPAKTYYANIAKQVLFIFSMMCLSIIAIGTFNLLLQWNSLGNLFGAIGVVALEAIVINGFFMLFLLPPINQYVIFKHQIQNKLRTGPLFAEKYKLVGWIGYGLFTFLIFVATPVTGVLLIGVNAFIASIVTAFVTNLLVEMEVKRLGISALFSTIKKYFDKKSEVNQAIITS